VARRVIAPTVGRGQATPAPPSVPAQVLLSTALLVPLDQLAPDPGQPRRHFDEEALAELARSIDQEGVLQPLLVYEDGALADGRARYVIVDGERRYRAALRVRSDAPVIVQDGHDLTDVRIRQLIVNLQREDLDPLEEALALRQLMQLADLSLDGVAGRIGKPKAYVQRRTDLLYDPRLASAVRDGRINASVAVELRRFPEEERQVYLERVAAGERLEVAQLREEKRRARAIVFGGNGVGHARVAGGPRAESYRIDTAMPPATAPQAAVESYRIDTAPVPVSLLGASAWEAAPVLLEPISLTQTPPEQWADDLARALAAAHEAILIEALRTWRAAGEPPGWGDALIARLAAHLCSV